MGGQKPNNTEALLTHGIGYAMSGYALRAPDLFRRAGDLLEHAGDRWHTRKGGAVLCRILAAICYGEAGEYGHARHLAAKVRASGVPEFTRRVLLAVSVAADQLATEEAVRLATEGGE